VWRRGATGLRLCLLGEGESIELLITTAFGLEAVAARELATLGYESRTLSTGRLLVRAPESAIARCNLWLRTADRVLLRVAEFPAADFDALFEGVQAIDWSRWLDADAAFPVNGRSVRSALTSVPAVQRTVKKGIVEALRRQHGVDELPETGARSIVEVALLNDRATITLDTSGEGLHKRGYRTMVGDAAIKETLAAGLVLLSTWEPRRPLVDPFAGTGTIAIEAALIGRNMAPGASRSFDAERWAWLDERVWEEARAEAADLAIAKLPRTIHATDIDPHALRAAHHHARAAGVERDVHVMERDFSQIASTLDYGCIITNPPYGKRLGEDEQVEALYRQFPVVLRRLPSWSFFIITAREDFEGLLGQPATRRRKLFNSQLECTYYQFLGPKPPWLRREDVGAAGAEPSRAEQSEADSAPDAAGDEGAGEWSDEAEAVLSDPLPVENETVRVLKAGPAPVFGGLRERDVNEIELFKSTLANNVRHLRRYPTRGITCYRVYEKDAPDVPLVIDRYEDAVHVFEHERGHSRTPAQHADWLDRCREVIAEVMETAVERVEMKTRLRQRGMTQHERMDTSNQERAVGEGGLRFLVNLRDYADTGLFLDHRLTRAMVREESAGKRVLNLFCYTGAFSVYAAAGGAAGTTSVDLSNTYLDWTRRNLELNEFRSQGAVEHRTIRADVREFLRSHEPGEHYDLAVIDPPTFSNSKKTEEDFEVQMMHPELIVRTAELMPPGGRIYFSNNFRQFKLNERELQGLDVREISARTVPPEYRNRRIHRCWVIQVPG
jgi:23S rRNA (guanine2445-N2)-methyltransferase / 23S rRNA (guanine2069-N7)-methyltransferase